MLVKIGIMDEERQYVEMLSSYLNRYGKGSWIVQGFTKQEKLLNEIQKNPPDIAMITDKKILEGFAKDYQTIQYIWLSNSDELIGEPMGYEVVSQYQSAKVIAQKIEKMVKLHTSESKPLIAMYSPVGRCGKTSFAWSVCDSDEFGDWLWVGMEDYPSIKADLEMGDFLFYIKERNEAHVLRMMEECRGKIVLSSLVFDMRLLEETDVMWFREVFCKTRYTGAIFDLGTGIIRNFDILALFDKVLVPYTNEEKAIIKKDNFKNLLLYMEKERLWEQMEFIDMGASKQVQQKRKEIFSCM